MNQLRKLNPPLYKIILLFALLDIAFGITLLTLSVQTLTVPADYPTTEIGKDVFGAILAAKGLFLIFLCLTNVKYQVAQVFFLVGLIIWMLVAISAVIGIFIGHPHSVLTAEFAIFIAAIRYVFMSIVPPREVV